MPGAFFFLCIFLVVPNNVVADDDAIFFSKFFQNDFDIKDDRPVVVSYNKRLLQEASVVMFKYNRTTSAINITILPLVDLTEENWGATLQTYKRYGNEYKVFPIRIKFNMCKTLKNNIMGIGTYTCGFVKCPVLKNIRQHGCNWIPDYSRLPPLIPDGQYNLKAYLTYDDQQLIDFEYFCTVYRKVKIM